jgi:hypothetical protein
MDRPELERQKTAEVRESSRDILALTRDYNASDQSDDDSHSSVDDNVVCHPNETYGIEEEILEDPLRAISFSARQVLNLTGGIGDDEVLKMKELEPNNCAVVPNMVAPTSPNGGDDIVMVQQPTPGAVQVGGLNNNFESRSAAPFQQGSSNERELSHLKEAVAGVFPGRTSPSALSESQGPSAIDEDSAIDEESTIMGELAEPSQEDEELRRRCQELQEIVNETVTVVNSGSGNHDQNTASSPFGRKAIIVLIGAAFALLLVIGVILGVNNKDSPSVDSAVTSTQSPAPSQSSTPTKAATAAPTACTNLDCLAKILLQNEVADAEALQDESSPQFLALRWLVNNDTAVLDLDSTPPVILVERYVMAVYYFASGAKGGLNMLNFLTASSVCEWKGVLCNGDDLVVALLLGESKHGEIIVLISKYCIDSHVYFRFRFSGVGE